MRQKRRAYDVAWELDQLVVADPLGREREFAAPSYAPAQAVSAAEPGEDLIERGRGDTIKTGMPLKGGSTVQQLGLISGSGIIWAASETILNPAHRRRYDDFCGLRDPYKSFISHSGLAGLAAQNCSVEPVQSGSARARARGLGTGRRALLSVSFLVKLACFGWVREGARPAPSPLALAGPMLLTNARIVQGFVPGRSPDRHHPRPQW